MSKDGTENHVVILNFFVRLKYFLGSNRSSLFTDTIVNPLNKPPNISNIELSKCNPLRLLKMS